MRSLEKHQSSNIYYVFVIKGRFTNFFIFPYHIIKKGIDQSNITGTSNRRYKVEISIIVRNSIWEETKKMLLIIKIIGV